MILVFKIWDKKCIFSLSGWFLVYVYCTKIVTSNRMCVLPSSWNKLNIYCTVIYQFCCTCFVLCNSLLLMFGPSYDISKSRVCSITWHKMSLKFRVFCRQSVYTVQALSRALRHNLWKTKEVNQGVKCIIE